MECNVVLNSVEEEKNYHRLINYIIEQRIFIYLTLCNIILFFTKKKIKPEDNIKNIV